VSADRLPRLDLARAPSGFGAAAPLADLPWDEVPPAIRLVRSQDGAPPAQATLVRACWDEAALYVRWDCADRDAWGTLTRRDDPLYTEEVVELFLAPGETDPHTYVELEISPAGVLFDGRITNPSGRGQGIVADTAWDCPGLAWASGSDRGEVPQDWTASLAVLHGVPVEQLVVRREDAQDWWAAVALPWRGLLPAGAVAPPRLWRANFYRIERPRDGGAAEHTAWSPTFADPPDFHRPARFGVLAVAGG
jgi:hypothetical protein